MRVLHLYAGNLYGGIERLLVTLAREREHCGAMDPHFGLCFDGQVAGELRAAGVPVHLLGAVRFSRPWTVWRARRRLAGLLARHPFDVAVCHACWPHALFARAVRAVGLPLAFWAHDLPDGRHWAERRAARTPPDLVIANSRYTGVRVPRLFPHVRCEVLHSLLPEHAFAAPGDDVRREVRRDVRSELQARPQDVVILTACRLEPWKGQWQLLEGLGRLRDVAGWTCWVAGGPQRPHEAAYLDELKGLAARAGIADRVRFLGHRTDVWRLLAAADVYCQPNTGPESLGLVFVEALAAGLPVVTTPLGAAPEVVTDSCGILVRPDDAVALSAALGRLTADPGRRTALGAAGPIRARQLSDPAARVVGLAKLLSSACPAAGVAA
jgi:glycosyltransferase involved in cell wall biosynthesis